MYFHAPRSANWSVLDTHHLCICLLSLKSAFGSEPQHGGAGCSLCSTLCKVNHGGSATGSTEAIAFTTRSAQTNQVLLPPAPILTSKSKIADEDGVVVARPPCKWQIYAVRDINNLLTLTWCVCLDDYIHLFFSPLHSKERPIQKEETIYGNWMDTMVTICEEITTESMVILLYLWGYDVCAKHLFALKALGYQLRITSSPHRPYLMKRLKSYTKWREPPVPGTRTATQLKSRRRF